MATVVTIEPGYSPRPSLILEICSHCNRPLCPHCWNHSALVDKESGLWECSNPACKCQFHYIASEGE